MLFRIVLLEIKFYFDERSVFKVMLNIPSTARTAFFMLVMSKAGRSQSPLTSPKRPSDFKCTFLSSSDLD